MTDDPCLKLKEILDDALKLEDIKINVDVCDRIIDVKTELRMNIDLKKSFNQFIKNSLKKDKYERYSIGEMFGSLLIKP